MRQSALTNTTRKYIILTFLGFILFSSCNIFKTIHLLKQGNISSSRFREEIPFEMRAGIIVIKVTIEGKVYDFIFDTGATNAVSYELSEKLNLKPVVHQTAVDFEGKSEDIGFAEIKQITIGKINFNNTACAIIDLKKVPEINCLKADGLIGGNLMRKAVWQIDYKNQKIIFTDNVDSLHIPTGTPHVSFTALLSGTPVFKGEINGIRTGKNIFDTGSSGGILLEKTDLDKLTAKNKTLKIIRGTGSNGSGLYGRKQDTTFFSKVPSVKIGAFTVKNQVVQFKKTDSGNFGSGFMKNYIVTFDWKNKKAWFIKQSDQPKQYWTTFGFVPIVKDGRMIIGYIYDNSSSQENGLKLNDQILSINSVDYSAIHENIYCDMVVNNFEWNNTDTLNMVIRSANENRQVKVVSKNPFNE